MVEGASRAKIEKILAALEHEYEKRMKPAAPPAKKPPPKPAPAKVAPSAGKKAKTTPKKFEVKKGESEIEALERHAHELTQARKSREVIVDYVKYIDKFQNLPIPPVVVNAIFITGLVLVAMAIISFALFYFDILYYGFFSHWGWFLGLGLPLTGLGYLFTESLNVFKEEEGTGSTIKRNEPKDD